MTEYLKEDESGNDAIKKVCKDFIEKYITNDMSDVEKELQIIKYLVETVEYDVETAEFDMILKIEDPFKAYGALVNKKAVCSGYAKAFDLLARECGLYTEIVTGTVKKENGEIENHAWNQICLDGEWYNVDVTWEDPITNKKFGFNELRNKYINRTDEEFSKDHDRHNGNECKSKRYGKKVIGYFLQTGVLVLEPDSDKVRRLVINNTRFLIDSIDGYKLNTNPLIHIGAKFDDNSNYFTKDYDKKITEYIKDRIRNGETLVFITTPKNLNYQLEIDKGNWLNDNIKQGVEVSMQMYYETGDDYDTRILYFLFK